MKTIRWGIIGCGDVTEKKSGPAFSKLPDGSELNSSVMRRNAEKAADYATGAITYPGGTLSADAAHFADEEVDAVYISQRPPSSHKEYTLKVAAAGKPVFVEKPMALNLSLSVQKWSRPVQACRCALARGLLQAIVATISKKCVNWCRADAIGEPRAALLRQFKSAG